MTREVNFQISNGQGSSECDNHLKRLLRLRCEGQQTRARAHPQPERGRSCSVCWGCRGRCHIRHNCLQHGQQPFKLRRAGSTSQLLAKNYKTQTRNKPVAVNSTIFEGMVGRQPTIILVDFASAVTSIGDDVWQKAMVVDGQHQAEMEQVLSPMYVAKSRHLKLHMEKQWILQDKV